MLKLYRAFLNLAYKTCLQSPYVHVENMCMAAMAAYACMYMYIFLLLVGFIQWNLQTNRLDSLCSYS
jgi:hypothetical protein